MKLPKYEINKYDPKKMMAIPGAIFVVALVIVLITFATTGLPVQPGIDFAGGTAVTIITDDTKDEISSYYSGYDLKSVSAGIGTSSYYLTFGPMSNEEMVKFNEYTLDRYPDASIDQIGANFGSTLQSQALLAILFAFLGMAVVVFIVFRKIAPAITVVAAALADITVTAAMMNILGIELSLATTAALLMLIGYSVDSNILLTTKLLKRHGKSEEKLEGAFHTGFIMTTTTLGALTAMFIVALIGQVPTLYSIGAVLIIGMLSDLVFTWAFNAGALRIYLAKTDKTQSRKNKSNTNKNNSSKDNSNKNNTKPKQPAKNKNKKSKGAKK